MTEPAALPPEAMVGMSNPAQIMDEPIERIGSWWVYAAFWRGRRQLLWEYAPAGVTTRGSDGLIAPHDGGGTWWLPMLQRVEQLGAALKRQAGHPAFKAQAVTHVERAGGTLVFLCDGTSAGESLAAVMQRADKAGPWAPESVRELALQLADAMTAAHDADLLHLDIAPATLMQVGDQIVLRGFRADERSLMRPAGGKAPFVRPPYSAIELYDDTGRASLSPATDIHAASALLYRLVTGADVPGWTSGKSRRPDAPGYAPAFLDAIERGLSTDPTQAFLSVAEWRAAMAPVVASEPAADGPPRWLPAAVLVALLLLGGSYGWQQGWFKPAAPSPAVAVLPTADPEPADVAGATDVLQVAPAAAPAEPVTSVTDQPSTPEPGPAPVVQPSKLEADKVEPRGKVAEKPEKKTKQKVRPDVPPPPPPKERLVRPCETGNHGVPRC